MLPDMNNFELFERTHIEGVIEKAKKEASPFVIRVTKADSAELDSVEDVDKGKFGSTVNQTKSTMYKFEQSINNETGVMEEKRSESTSLSEELEKQQNVEIHRGVFTETNAIKLEDESSSDARIHFEKSRSEEVSSEISNAGMEHIQKVGTATTKKAYIQCTDWHSCSQETVRNLQDTTAVNSSVESKAAEEINTLEGRDMDNIPDLEDVLASTDFLAESVKPEKILNATEITCTTQKKLEGLEVDEANSMEGEKSVQETDLKLIVKKINSSNDFCKAESATPVIEEMKFSQNSQGHKKGPIGDKVMHPEELEVGINQPERFGNTTVTEVVETETVNLTDKELGRIGLMNEQAKEIVKLNGIGVFAPEETKEYKHQETEHGICVIEKELEQPNEERVKEVQAAEESFFNESENDKEMEEENDHLYRCNLLQANTLKKQAIEMESFTSWTVEGTTMAEDQRRNKDFTFPENNLIYSIEGQEKNSENNMRVKKETETSKDHGKENTLTEEEIMQIRAVEQRAKQVEATFNFEGKFAKTLEENTNSELKTLGVEGKSANHFTAKELEHIKEVERNAIQKIGTPLPDQFGAKNDVTPEINQVEVSQKSVLSGVVAFNKFVNMLNPLRSSVSTKLSFKSNAATTRLSQNTAFMEDISGKKQRIAQEPIKESSADQNCGTDVPTASKIEHFDDSAVPTTVKDLAAIQTFNEYTGNQDSEYISSSKSSNFGPGTSDEDEEIDRNSVESSDFYGASSTAPEYKVDTGISKLREFSAKCDTIGSTDLPLEIIPSPSVEILRNSKTKVFNAESKQILELNSSSSFTDVAHVRLDVKDSYKTEQFSDGLAGLTEVEIEHIKMVELQFELEDAVHRSKVFLHEGDISEAEHIENFAKEMILVTEEHEPWETEPTINVTEPMSSQFIVDNDKVESDTLVKVKSMESEKEIGHDEAEELLRRLTMNDILLDQSLEKDETSGRQSKLRRSVFAEAGYKLKSFEEIGREENIGKWYEERLRSLKNSLHAEERGKYPGFELKLHNSGYEKVTFAIH